MQDDRTILRRILYLDAATCAAMALLCLAARTPLSAATGLPPGLVLGAGLALVPSALFMAAVGRGRPPSRASTGLVVAGNALWVAASLALLALVPLTGLGVAFVLLQAGAVALLATAEARLMAPAARIGAAS
ncbi:hypothetical protein [Acuticoccus kandeliae]|uniref:hypothetical protein n=1 Tax=Acuticoccus kandeliae TaxID=2073160 RepID=UPI001300AF94|nr:hypothetical protein [Acuticoccus kandeliae]